MNTWIEHVYNKIEKTIERLKCMEEFKSFNIRPGLRKILLKPVTSTTRIFFWVDALRQQELFEEDKSRGRAWSRPLLQCKAWGIVHEGKKHLL